MKIKILVFIVSLSFFVYSFAHADSSSVQVNARALPSRVTVGDEIRFLIQVERPKAFSIETPSDKINLSPFEIKRVEVSPLTQGKNRVRETFILILTAFQLGDLKIPPLSIHYRDATGQEGQLSTPVVDVKVVSVGKKPTDKEDIRPIKGPVSFDLSFMRTWILGILAALLSIFLVTKIILRRRQAVADPESLKPPHERVLLEIERLQKKGLLQEQKVKEFYSELSDILRRYLEQGFQMEALERTTYEIALELKEKNFERAAVEKIKGVLQNADLVKFAKFVPPPRLADELVRAVCEVVDLTKPKEEVSSPRKRGSN